MNRYSIAPWIIVILCSIDFFPPPLKSLDWVTCFMTVITCCVTLIVFCFLLCRDAAAGLQTGARCTVLHLPEGEDSRGVWHEPTEPARPRIRVSDGAELFKKKNHVISLTWSYTICISVLTINICTKCQLNILGFPIWPKVFSTNVRPINKTMNIRMLVSWPPLSWRGSLQALGPWLQALVFIYGQEHQWSWVLMFEDENHS